MYKVPEQVTGVEANFKNSSKEFKKLFLSFQGLRLIPIIHIGAIKYPKNYYDA
jgi:hypothetical protein